MINFQHIIPKQRLTQLLGKLADSRTIWLKNFLIRLAMKHYGIRLEEAELNHPDNYPSFNAFFTRALTKHARPINPEPMAWASPADGVISEKGTILAGALMQAKNRFYALNDMVGNDRQARQFEKGNYLTVYLSPKDYHRVHMPCDGTLVSANYLPGELFAVNQKTTQTIPRVFARNERLVAHFTRPEGDFLLVFVGALFVAGIETVWDQSGSLLRPTPDHFTPNTPMHFAKGDEVGRFHFGSTVVLITEPNLVHWHTEQSAIKMGESIGEFVVKPTTQSTEVPQS